MATEETIIQFMINGVPVQEIEVPFLPPLGSKVQLDRVTDPDPYLVADVLFDPFGEEGYEWRVFLEPTR